MEHVRRVVQNTPVGAVWDKLVTAAENIFNKVRGIVETFITWFTGKFGGVIDKVTQVAGFLSGATANNAAAYAAQADSRLAEAEARVNAAMAAKGITPQPILGMAAGGIATSPILTKFAENAPRVPEAAIPVENTRRSFDLWSAVGQMAGFFDRFSSLQGPDTGDDSGGLLARFSRLQGADSEDKNGGLLAASRPIGGGMRGAYNSPTINHTINITLNGNTDEETVTQVEQVTSKSQADFASWFESFSREQARLAY